MKNKNGSRWLRLVSSIGRFARWQPLLGGLFFPCSGNGNGRSWNNRTGNGNFWSSTFNSSRNARNLNFNSGGVNPQNNNNRYNGFAVRAVQLFAQDSIFLTIPRLWRIYPCMMCGGDGRNRQEA